MTVGLPGAGIGGLFYLASTFLLPVRSLARRLRGRPDSLPPRHLAHSVLIAVGIISALWVAGWLLALVMPDEMLAGRGGIGGVTGVSRNAIPIATFGVAVGTLAFVLLAVEVAHRVQVIRAGSRDDLQERRWPCVGTLR